MGTVLIAHASKDERGAYQGGKAGDQTGQEVCIRSWYNRPWNVVLRAKNPKVANKIATAMERAAKNDHIGYDQSQRNTLLSKCRDLGYDPGRVTSDCETDCSALVSVACMYGGVPETTLFIGGNSATTRTLRKRLMDTGDFLEFTSAGFVKAPNLLERGDILLYEGHHVAVVTSTTYSGAVVTTKKSLDDAAKDVIAGKYGNGVTRETKLREQGYSPIEVQAKVNEILKGGK